MNLPFKDYFPPPFDIWCMKMVYLVAEKSRDPRTKIGAVLVKEKNIISTGYNGFPMGVRDENDRYKCRETKYKFVVHAEHNSILFCARFGISSLDSTLYTNGLPCNSCMKSIINGGVKKIVIHKQWPEMTHSDWIESSKISKIMMDESKVRLQVLDEKLGVKGYLDGKIIDV
jgi:dCMP deaminase